MEAQFRGSVRVVSSEPLFHLFSRCEGGFGGRQADQVVSDAMAISNWTVTYPVNPAVGPNDRLPLGAKMVSSLSAALDGVPVEAWAFEVGGETVESLAEFQRLFNQAESASLGEFVARANGIVVEPC